MNIHEAMQFIAAQYGLNHDALPLYADRDPHTGWDRGEGRYPIGSLWRVEGQVLYGLVYATQPRRIVELGTHHGASATHITQAIADLGSEHDAHLTCVDVWEGAGGMIPDDLRRHVTLEYTDAIAWLANQPDNSIDFLYEDMHHTAEQVGAVATLAQTKLRPGGWLICHDALHYVVGNAVQQGLRDAGVLDTLMLLIEPSDCGLAIWRKPGTAEPVAEAVTPAKPKRSSKKNAS